MNAAPAAESPTTGRDLERLVAGAAIAFPLVYFVSDLVEVAQGDFSTFRLTLTYTGEAGFPLFVLGLLAIQHQEIGRWGILGGVAYAYSFVFFTSTVVWAIVAGTPTWEALNEDLGWWLTIHGAVMVVGGVAFGLGVAKAGFFPRWTGYTLAVGVLLVAAASGAGNIERALASALPAAAFIGMGIHLLRRRSVSSPMIRIPSELDMTASFTGTRPRRAR